MAMALEVSARSAVAFFVMLHAVMPGAITNHPINDGFAAYAIFKNSRHPFI